MDSNNINSPNHPNMPDTPDTNHPPQGEPPYYPPYGRQDQTNTVYGNSSGTPDPGANPYGIPSNPQGQNSTPYGMQNNPQSLNNSPYGMQNNPQAPSNNPYGMQNSPQNLNNNPYGMANDPQGQDNAPYGMQNSPQASGNNPYGMQNNPQGQNSNPYRNPNETPYPDYYQPVRQSPADGLMTASMALGIAAILTAVMATVYFPFILGGISIILALLSKGYDEKMASRSKIGVACAIVGLVLNVFIVSISIHKVFTDESTFYQFDRIYEQMYGESFRDMYRKTTGQDFPIDFDD